MPFFESIYELMKQYILTIFKHSSDNVFMSKMDHRMMTLIRNNPDKAYRNV